MAQVLEYPAEQTKLGTAEGGGCGGGDDSGGGDGGGGSGGGDGGEHPGRYVIGWSDKQARVEMGRLLSGSRARSRPPLR